ncbi:hypothetical protein MNB_SM-7-1297 [hydrothermal vent metagenome]|uniref:Thioredoxin-like fold domain-containing protein n=1 Tax=hydrothermal vent metagenome TaxID=652676 RepID=A0A1W1BX84_9ZZZZ
MKKLFLVAALFMGINLFASQIHWVSSYKEALALSKKERKPIMFVMTKSDCKYCKLLKSTTFKDPKIVATLNKSFVNYMVETDDEGATVPYLLAVYTKGFPTIWFLDEHGKALFQPIGGYMKAQDFTNALDVVTKTYKKYLSNSAKKGK